MSSCRCAACSRRRRLRPWRSVWVGTGLARRPVLRPQDRPAEVPLSYAQRRLWFLDRLEGGGSTYVIPLAVRLAGALDVSALEGALADLIDRHESLRTVYPERVGVPRQEILTSGRGRFCLTVSQVAEAELPERSDLPRRRAGSICAVSFRCGRMCMGCRMASMCCCCCCITSPGTGGRSGCWVGTSGSFMRARCGGTPPSLPAASGSLCRLHAVAA